MQTPATRMLDNLGINYTLHRYEHDPQAKSFGIEAAELLGLDQRIVFKTLMAQVGPTAKDLVVAIVGVGDLLDLKKLARAAGTKRAGMAPIPDAERATGYVAGGISPFGQRKRHRTFVDVSAADCELVYVSGGQRGLDLSIAPADLCAVLDATTVELAADG